MSQRGVEGGRFVWSDDSIPGYRGLPGCSAEERFWDPAKPPCVPSDHRPAHLFNSREAAEAAGAAARVERFAPQPSSEGEEGSDSEDLNFDEEQYELACIKHKHAMRRLHASFPEAAEEHHPHAAVPVWSRRARHVAMGGPD